VGQSAHVNALGVAPSREVEFIEVFWRALWRQSAWRRRSY
jgi:hypothetical protein